MTKKISALRFKLRISSFVIRHFVGYSPKVSHCEVLLA
jgi:hypothetical protein